MVVELMAPPEAGERRLRMTYEEYLAMPSDGIHAEWVRGEVIIFMPPNTLHQDVVTFLTTLLRLIVDEFRLGRVFESPYEMRLPEQQTSREPDILFVASAHLDRIGEKRLTGPADLVIEVISDSTERSDRRDKFREYARAGVPEYWMVDVRPGQRPIEPYMLVEGGYKPILPDEKGRYRSIVLPVFWLDPAWLRQYPLPRPLAVLALVIPEALRAAAAATYVQEV